MPVTSNFLPEETLYLLTLGSSSWLKIDRKSFCQKKGSFYVFPKARGHSTRK
jgi:hypothetical protein